MFTGITKMNGYGERKYLIDGGFINETTKYHYDEHLVDIDNQIRNKSCIDIRCDVKPPTIAMAETMPDSDPILVFCQGAIFLTASKDQRS